MAKKIKKTYRKFKRYVLRRPLVMIIVAAVALVTAISATVVSCSAARFTDHVTGSGLILSDGYWVTDDNNFKYYERDGYTSTVGIDVSEWVQDIDFNAVKKMGVDFALFRVGYRGYVTGGFVLDNNLNDYLKKANKAGLKLGVYFVSQAINEQEAIEEANYVMDKVKGYNMEMPLYIDLEPVYDNESDVRTAHLNADDYTKIAIAFCDAVEEAGYRGGIYANEQWYNDNLNFNKIKKYDIWLAKYTDELDCKMPVNMWQYTCQGNVDGASMWVDLNVRVSLTDSDE